MIPRELFKKIRKIEITTSRLAASHLAGQYASVFKGRGMAFSEVRPYIHGDDARAIDWNVSARMQEAYIKLFVEERDRTVNLLIDMSASGTFGSRGGAKREVAAQVAAAIAFSAITHNDRVGLIMFTDEIELYVPPKKGKRHVLRVIREILSFEPRSPRTDLACGLELLGKVARRRQVAFVVSDFLASGYQQRLRIAARRHDVVPVVVSDPLEAALPRLGIVALEDLETGQVCELDTLGRDGRAFSARVARAVAAREETFRRLGLEWIDVRTDRPYEEALIRFFRIRAARAARAAR
ncbi:MAG TPA: DUF58 domain-containing protein [Kofleriaceae bacterium]|nr:DUF58 domain-containing protein [Kofleriaceae bacterium]